MSICLVTAPTVPDVGEIGKGSKIRQISDDAPLGILSLAAVLDQLKIESQIVFLNRCYYDYVEASNRCLDFCEFAACQLAVIPTRIFGFSTICNSYPLTIRMAAELRRLRPDSIIILGGPQASVVDEETLRAFPWVDVVVRGEAEYILPQLLQALMGSTALAIVPGITFRQGSEVVRNTNASLIQDLNTLPLPAFYRYLDRASRPSYVSLEVGRGCPFSCTFCSTNDFFRRRFRLKSPQRMLEQMTYIQETYGVSRFELVHDMFTVDKRRVVEFCEALIASGKQFSWSCSARTDCVDAALIELLAKAGCSGIFFGIETGSARLQKLIDKSLDLDEAAHAIHLTCRHGIRATASLIMGFPEESRQDLRQTVDFFTHALRYDTVEPQLHILAPLAKTPLQIQYRNQLILEDHSFNMSDIGWEQSPADRELIHAWPDIFCHFYSLPTTLNQQYLEECRAFFLATKFSFRWLLLALAKEGTDLLEVFDSWRAWFGQHKSGGSFPTMKYYCSTDFGQDFVYFLQVHYQSQLSPCNSVARTMLDYEIKWRQSLRILPKRPLKGAAHAEIEHRVEVTLDLVPTLACDVCLVPIPPEVTDAIRQLKIEVRDDEGVRHSGPDFLCLHNHNIVGECTEILELSPLSSLLLGLCDGQSTLEDICLSFAAKKIKLKKLEDLTPRQICVSGLVNLAEQGLLSFRGLQTQ